jgi:hypothetical protein
MVEEIKSDMEKQIRKECSPESCKISLLEINVSE